MSAVLTVVRPTPDWVVAWLLFGWPGQIALCVFAAWFAWGAWKAVMRPRLTYISHTALERKDSVYGKALLTVKRQQLLPPFLAKEETWLIDPPHECIREHDGEAVNCGGYGNRKALAACLIGCLKVARARQQETDELLKDEKARVN